VEMNKTGCPDGWATDTVIFFTNQPLACDLSIAAWIVFAVLLTSAKFFIAVGYSYLWVKRESKKSSKPKSNQNRKQSQRIPLIPIVQGIMFLVYVGFFASSILLGSDGIPNHGVPLFFFGLGWGLFSLCYFLYLNRFIKLGHKMVSRSRTIQWTKILGIESLSVLDTFGKINLLIIVLALAGQTIALCIFGLIYPENYTIVQIGAAFEGWFNVQTAVAIIYQIQRVRNV
jgi:MFS family permease